MAVITFAHRGARLEEPENTIPAFRRALEPARRGLETDVWLSADGEVVCAHDPTVRRRRAPAPQGRRRRPRPSWPSFGVPRLADVYEELGTDFELLGRREGRRGRRGRCSRSRARYGALERLWVCTPDVERAAPRCAPSRRSSSCTRPGAGRSTCRSNATRTTSRSIGIDAMNMHHTEWTAGLVSLFHRFDVQAFAWDTQEVRHLRAVLRMDIDARLLRPPRPHGRDRRRVELERRQRESRIEPGAT